MMLTTACSSKKALIIQAPFLGFTTYDKPKEVQIEVERNCVATYMLNDYKTTVKVGDCIRIEDTKKLVTKIKTLEKIVDNYELDIQAYNRLYAKENK